MSAPKNQIVCFAWITARTASEGHQPPIRTCEAAGNQAGQAGTDRRRHALRQIEDIVDQLSRYGMIGVVDIPRHNDTSHRWSTTSTSLCR